jgi:hypothetical protein
VKADEAVEVTGSTITDVQIRRLLRETKGRRKLAEDIREACRCALIEDGREAGASLRRNARAFCAGVLNSRARHAGASS